MKRNQLVLEAVDSKLFDIVHADREVTIMAIGERVVAALLSGDIDFYEAASAAFGVEMVEIITTEDIEKRG